jgi:pimeloyl-ACP methyl ester carboxylesterase
MAAVYLSEFDCYIRYVELHGRQPVRLFLHGLAGASSHVGPELFTQPPLAGHHTLLVDQIGFGFSDAPHTFSYTVDDHARAVAGLIDQLDLTDVQLIGHSLGGAVAIWVAALRPERVAHVVSLEGNLDVGREGIASTTIALQSWDEFEGNGWSALSEWVREYSPDWYGVVRRTDPYAVYHSARGLHVGTQPLTRQQLYSLSMPKTVVVGELSTEIMQSLDELMSHGVDTRVVPNAGHNMVRDEPLATAQAIADALSDVRQVRL